jgi:hypothetical protein
LEVWTSTVACPSHVMRVPCKLIMVVSLSG